MEKHAQIRVFSFYHFANWKYMYTCLQISKVNYILSNS